MAQKVKKSGLKNADKKEVKAVEPKKEEAKAVEPKKEVKAEKGAPKDTGKKKEVSPEEHARVTKQAIEEIKAGLSDPEAALEPGVCFVPLRWVHRYKDVLGPYKKFLQDHTGLFKIVERGDANWSVALASDEVAIAANEVPAQKWQEVLLKAWQAYCIATPKLQRSADAFVAALPGGKGGQNPPSSPALKPAASPALKPAASPALKPAASPALKPAASPALKPAGTAGKEGQKPPASPAAKPADSAKPANAKPADEGAKSVKRKAEAVKEETKQQKASEGAGGKQKKMKRKAA